MGLKNYKKTEEIEVVYQAAKAVIDSTASAVTNLDGDVVAVKAVVDGIKSDIDDLEIASPPMVC